MTIQPDEAWIEAPGGVRFPLAAPFSLGRSPDNTFVIANGRASRHHALVQARAPGEYWLTDLNSRNGVFLNRQAVQNSARLHHLDSFHVADILFIFHTPGTFSPTGTDGATGEMTITTRRTIHAWLLIADIVGSVGQAQRDPQLWPEKIATWIGGCEKLVAGSKGRTAKFLGDGFLAFWDRDQATPGDFTRGLHALLAQQASSPLTFRLVAHFGPIQQMGIARGELSLTGDTVNFTFRLEKVASALGQPAVITRECFEAAQSPATWRTIGVYPVPSFEGTRELFIPVIE